MSNSHYFLQRITFGHRTKINNRTDDKKECFVSELCGPLSDEILDKNSRQKVQFKTLFYTRRFLLPELSFLLNHKLVESFVNLNCFKYQHRQSIFYLRNFWGIYNPEFILKLYINIHMYVFFVLLNCKRICWKCIYTVMQSDRNSSKTGTFHKHTTYEPHV